MQRRVRRESARQPPWREIESGEMEDIWFIRRLTVAVLGATKMTDEKGQLRWIGWKDGKLVIGPITYERPIACQLHETRLTGAPSMKPPPGFTSRLMHDAAEEEQKRRDGVVVQ